VQYKLDTCALVEWYSEIATASGSEDPHSNPANQARVYGFIQKIAMQLRNIDLRSHVRVFI
jgi:hypothetical protein